MRRIVVQHRGVASCAFAIELHPLAVAPGDEKSTHLVALICARSGKNVTRYRRPLVRAPVLGICSTAGRECRNGASPRRASRNAPRGPSAIDGWPRAASPAPAQDVVRARAPRPARPTGPPPPATGRRSDLPGPVPAVSSDLYRSVAQITCHRWPRTGQDPTPPPNNPAKTAIGVQLHCNLSAIRGEGALAPNCLPDTSGRGAQVQPWTGDPAPIALCNRVRIPVHASYCNCCRLADRSKRVCRQRH